MGGGKDDDKEVTILGRIVRWTPEGIEYEADPKHAQVILRDLGSKGGKEVTSPAVKRVLHNDGGL